MAKVVLTALTPNRTGETPTATAKSLQVGVAIGTTDQYQFPNSGSTVLRIDNSTAAATMTVVTTETINGLALADQTVSIVAGATVYLTGFQPEYYNDSEGRVEISFAAADATLEIEVIEP